MKPPIDGGNILITGTSSGIGREMARQLAPRAKSLVLVARRKERLEDLKGELLGKYPALTVRVEACDLTDLEAADGMLQSVREVLGGIDILVNNAGMGSTELFEGASWDKLHRMLKINVVSLTHLTHRVLGSMLDRGRGGILNVSSGFGLTFMPGAAAYAGTKHYVTAFTESLRMELVGTGVVVSQLCPGPVATEFEDVAGNPTGQAVPGWAEISAEKCARMGLKGFSRGRALTHAFSLPMNLAIWGGRWTPRFVLRLVYRPVGPYLRRLAGSKKELSS